MIGKVFSTARRRFFSTVITASSAGVLMFAAADTFAQDEPKRGGTLIQAIADTPRHLNPAVQSGIATGEPGTQLFASPLRYDEDWTPQPYLAESWETSDDGLTVTLNLVQGATFHDGEPITSADVAFSIKTVQENHPFKAMFAPVTRVDTPDVHTAVINLDAPHPALLLAMSSQLLPIIPKHIYDDGQDIKTHPRNSENVIGSGPFKLTEFNREEHIILDRYDDFFIEGRPYLDRIVMRIIEDSQAHTIALANGEAQLSGFQPVPQNIVRLKETEGVVVSDEGYGAIGPITWLAFNTQQAPTSDVKVRQAIAYAVDRNFINNALMRGTSRSALTGIHPDSPFYDPSVEPYEVDLDKANALLDEAGYEKDSDGMRFALTIDYASDETKSLAEYLRPQLKKIGINISVRAPIDFPTWAKRISNWEFDMTWDTVFNWGDPVIGVHRTYLSSNITKGVIWSNTQQYENAKVDELLAAAANETDLDKRKALYSEFQQIVAEDVPIYFGYAVPYHTVSAENVGNPPRGIWATVQPLDRVYLK